jgi:hypothetical protein
MLKLFKTLLDVLRHVSIHHGSSSGSSPSFPYYVADVKPNKLFKPF